MHCCTPLRKGIGTKLLLPGEHSGVTKISGSLLLAFGEDDQDWKPLVAHVLSTSQSLACQPFAGLQEQSSSRMYRPALVVSPPQLRSQQELLSVNTMLLRKALHFNCDPV